MKLFILAHALRAGGGRATCINLLTALSKLNTNEVFLLVPDQAEFRALHLENVFHEVVYFKNQLGYLWRWFFDAFILKIMIFRFKPDLIWSMGGLALAKPPCKQVVSIQNSYLFYQPKYFGHISMKELCRLFFLKRSFRRQLPKTQMVICQTHTIENRVREIYGFSAKTLVTWKALPKFADTNE